MRRVWGIVAAGLVVSLSIALHAQQAAVKSKVPPMSPAKGIVFGDDMMRSARYEEAVVAYQRARLSSTDDGEKLRAGEGEVKGILRMAGFTSAVDEAAAIAEQLPSSGRALAILGDALWAAGRFVEAETAYARALTLAPDDARALHGRGRSLAAQGKLADGLVDIDRALAAEPTEELFLYSRADVLEQMRRFPEAADALDRYRQALPDAKKNSAAQWALAQANVLRRFGAKTPFVLEGGDSFTIPFTIVGDKVFVKARVNGGAPIDVVVDTGAEHTALTPETARRFNVEPLAVVPTAGIGERKGLRELQMGRIDQLQVGPLVARNVACFIKAPALTDVPIAESQAFAPLALGLSMSIDYQKKELTLARQLPAADHALRLPLRMQRLAMVRGTLNGNVPANFVVDTGGELGLVVSGRLAARLNVDPSLRRIPINVFGTAGRDKSAAILPFVDVDFGSGVAARRASVAVLNLDAPSSLLGIDIGGIVGHGFLSKYKVTFDMLHSELVLQ